MQERLKSNSDVKNLNVENDLFNTIPKGDAIISVLKAHGKTLIEKDLRMIALYGNWGSGKTSLLNYIKSKLERAEDTKIIIFKAWEMENDKNLALSLLEQIFEEFYQDNKFAAFKKEIKIAGNTLLKLAKNILLNTSIEFPTISVDIGSAGKKTIDEMEKIHGGNSQYNQVKEFKKKFRELIDSVSNKLINIYVFIDDLDRCEPENVITLISNIKLFFTFSEKIIYLCAIDKSAVSTSLSIKYKDVIKSEEYLEKVFDVSFNMPKTNMLKIIKSYFPRLSDKDKQNIKRFFDTIDFHNPRKIIKIFNKYEIIRYISQPNPLFADQDIFLIIFTLYFLILIEYHQTSYNEFMDLENRINNYIEKVNQYEDFYNLKIDDKGSELQFLSVLDGIINKKILVIDSKFISDHLNIQAFLLIFTPLFDKIRMIPHYDINFDMYKAYINQFKNKKNRIFTSFVSFILGYAIIRGKNKEIEIKKFELFELIRNIELYY